MLRAKEMLNIGWDQERVEMHTISDVFHARKGTSDSMILKVLPKNVGRPQTFPIF